MKKVYATILTVCIVALGFSQNTIDADHSGSLELEKSNYNIRNIPTPQSKKQLYKLNPGGWLSQASLMQSKGGFWQTPTFSRLFPDSFVNIVGTDGMTFQPGFHAIGSSFDPRDPLYVTQTTDAGGWQVGLHDSYNLDSIRVQYVYVRETRTIQDGEVETDLIDTLFVYYIGTNGMNQFRFTDLNLGGFGIPTGLNVARLAPLAFSYVDTILLNDMMATQFEREGTNLDVREITIAIPENLRRVDHLFNDFGSRPIGFSLVYKPGISYSQLGEIKGFQIDENSNVANISQANNIYPNVSTTLAGKTATFNISRGNDGKVNDITLVNGGKGFSNGDILTINANNIGGSRGLIETILFTGSILPSQANENYASVTGSSNQNGTGASFDVSRDMDGKISNVTIVNAGMGYINSEDITISGTLIGGQDGVITEVTLSNTTTIISEANNVYNNLSGNTNGNGMDASFTAYRDSTGNLVLDSIFSGGEGYNINDSIVIAGTAIGGNSPEDDLVIKATAIKNDNLTIRVTKTIVDNLLININNVSTGDTIINFSEDINLATQFNDFGVVTYNNEGSNLVDGRYFNNTFVSNRQVRYGQLRGTIRGHLPFIANGGWTRDVYLASSFHVSENEDRRWGSVATVAQPLATRVYPNPVAAGGNVTVQLLEEVTLSEVKIKMLDILGNQISTKTAIMTDAAIEVSTENLAKGIYLIQVSFNNKSTTHRVFVQ